MQQMYLIVRFALLAFRISLRHERMLLALQTLPYWDWTEYYSSGCVIPNPFYEDESSVELSEEDCKV